MTVAEEVKNLFDRYTENETEIEQLKLQKDQVTEDMWRSIVKRIVDLRMENRRIDQRYKKLYYTYI